MKIDTKIAGSIVSLKIEGQITGIMEVQSIKSNIENNLENANEVKLILKDAYVMPSSLIGYLVKLVRGDEKTVVIEAKTELKNLLSDLDLKHVFTIR